MNTAKEDKDEDKEDKHVMVKVYIDRCSGRAVIVREGANVSSMKLPEEVKKILAENPVEKTADLKQHPLCMESNNELIIRELDTKGYFMNVIENNRGKV